MKNRLPFVQAYASQNYSKAEDGIKYAYEHDCRYWYIDGSLEADNPNSWSITRVNNMQNLIDNFSVKPIYHGNFKVPIASDVEEIRVAALEYIKKEIDLCQKLQAPLIVHGGGIVEPRLIKQIKRKALENFVLSVNEILEYALTRGVIILLENLSNYINHRPFHYIFTQEEEYEYVFEKFPDLKMFFDIGHSNIADGKPNQVIRKYHKKIYGMSFSNNDGVRDQHLPIGQGEIDYKTIVKTIVDVNWSGVAAFETRGVSPKKSINDLSNIYLQVMKNAN